MKTPTKWISAGAVAGLAICLSSTQDLPANVDMTTHQQGIPLQGVHPQQYAHPAQRGLFMSPGAEAEARRHQEAAARQLRDIEWGARDHRMDGELHEFSQIKELPVENRIGAHLGHVEDLLMDLENDRVEFVIVATDEPGEYRAVPPRSFQLTAREDALVLDISERRWRQAPALDRNELARLDDEHRSREIYRYYESDFRARTWGARRAISDRPAAGPRHRPGRPHAEAWSPDQRADTQPRERAGSPNLARDDRAATEWAGRAETRETPRLFGMRTRAPRAHDEGPSLNNPRMHASVRRSQPGSRGPATGFTPDDEQARETVYAARDEERHQRVWRAHDDGRLQQASDLIGQEIQTEDEQAAGEISDFLVDIRANRVEYIVIDSQEAGQRFAVPADQFRSAPGTHQLALAQPLPSLEDTPDFNRQVAIREQRVYRYDDTVAREWAAPRDRDPEHQRTQEEELEFGAPEHRDPEAHREDWEDEIREEERDDMWDRDTGPRGQERGQDGTAGDRAPY